MLLKNRLFTPGPTPLLPAAQTAMAAFSLHHRTADFKALFSRVLSDMKDFIGTKNDVLVLSCSGTGVLEGSVSNLTSPGRQGSGADRRKIRRALARPGQDLRLQCRIDQRSLRRNLLAQRNQAKAHARHQSRLCAGHRKLHRRSPRRAGNREAGSRQWRRYAV